MAWHALQRFFLHVVGSAFAVIAAYITLLWLLRKFIGWSVTTKAQLIAVVAVAAFAVFGIASLREAWDVYNGQPYWKAVTDMISWVIGPGLSAWAIYRIERG